jgi:hypothetical protein
MGRKVTEKGEEREVAQDSDEERGYHDIKVGLLRSPTSF